MIYIVRNSDNTIKSFSENNDNVLQEGETVEEINESFEAFARRFFLSADKTKIIANGIDQSIVTVETNTDAASIDVLINDTEYTVSISDGVGQLPPITADLSGEILIKAVDQTLYTQSGNGSILIVAEEVSS